MDPACNSRPIYSRRSCLKCGDPDLKLGALDTHYHGGEHSCRLVDASEPDPGSGREAQDLRRLLCCRYVFLRYPPHKSSRCFRYSCHRLCCVCPDRGEVRYKDDPGGLYFAAHIPPGHIRRAGSHGQHPEHLKDAPSYRSGLYPFQNS